MRLIKIIPWAGLFLVGNVMAGPADYVYLPEVVKGEREIDFKFGTGKVSGEDRERVSSLGFGYGATEYWFSEFYFKREDQGSEGLSIAEWENRFQLTETGKYPVDVGLITEIEAPLQGGHPYEFKILFTSPRAASLRKTLNARAGNIMSVCVPKTFTRADG